MSLEIRRYEEKKPMTEVVEVRLDNLDEVQAWGEFPYYETAKNVRYTKVMFPTLKRDEPITYYFYHGEAGFKQEPCYMAKVRHLDRTAHEITQTRLDYYYVELKEGEYEDSHYLDSSSNDAS